MQQFTLDFEPGITDQYPRWEDTFTTIVYRHKHGLNGVAGDCDQSPSELSKRLSYINDDSTKEPRPLRSKDIIGILRSTQDFLPIFWLIEEFLKNPEVKRQEAIEQLSQIMPRLHALIEQAGVKR